LHLGIAGERADRRATRSRPWGLARNRRRQDDVVVEGVEADRECGLILHHMGREPIVRSHAFDRKRWQQRVHLRLPWYAGNKVTWWCRATAEQQRSATRPAKAWTASRPRAPVKSVFRGESGPMRLSMNPPTMTVAAMVASMSARNASALWPSSTMRMI